MSQNNLSSFRSKYTKFAPALRGGLLALALLAGFAPHAMSLDETTSTPTAATAQQSYAGMVSRVAPAVVTVRSEKRARAPQQHPFLDDPTLRDFFGDRVPRGNQQPRERRQSGLGSGVIVSADGYILTNHHVIDGAEQIKVQLNDNRSLNAKVIGSDPPSDLAVLKVEASRLPMLTLGDSDAVRVGDIALAIGNPLGLGQTVTSGIISAKGRTTGLSDGSFEDFIQTDAAINQGNSGGALVNAQGELIGINSQILSPTGGNIGIGFAIPSNMAKSVMNQLIQTGTVRRGILGVVVQPITADLAESLGLNSARGVIVSSVQEGGSASRAGVRRGDVITKLNGVDVVDSNTFRNRIASTTPGAQVTLAVVREGREQEVRATLGDRGTGAPNGNRQSEPAEGRQGETGQLGLRLEPLTPELASQFRLGSEAQGLVVTSVDPEGVGAEAGIERGDVILEVNRQSVRTLEQMRTALRNTGSRPILLLISRGENSLFLTVRQRG